MMIKNLFFSLLFCCVTLTSYAGNISHIVFFGDSLTDNGKVYKLLLHIAPKSPPYYQGRFSNGLTWAEDLGKYYYDRSYIASKNFAMGGATAALHIPNSKFMSLVTLEMEISAYLLTNLTKNKSHGLYVIWIGANDYLFANDGDMDRYTDNIIHKIISGLSTLKNHGANNFLVMNLPDLGRLPFARKNQIESKLHAYTLLHNLKLDAAVEEFKYKHPEVNIFRLDAYERLNKLLDNTAEENEKFHINITDTTNACWVGGFMFKALSRSSLINEIHQAQRQQNIKPEEGDEDAEAISEFIMNSPELSYTYALGKSFEYNNTPCLNANEHVFWDGMHPTDIVHQVLAKVVVETLGSAV